VLELARTLRSEGFVVTEIRAGDFAVSLEPVIVPQQSKPRTAKADVGGVLAEYGGPAIEKLLEDGDDYVPALKS
jgi:hypothetical protein